MTTKETRALREIELRADDDGRHTLAGYAAVFNSLSEDLGGFREVIRPGAFSRTLREREDFYALADHDPGRRLGRLKNSTLRLREDTRGLKVEIDLPDTSLGKDVLEEVRSGLLDAMSFGFVAIDAEFRREGDDLIRELRDVDLYEVSAVSMPAYRATNLDMVKRSLDAWLDEQSPAFKPTVFKLQKLKEIA